METHTGGIRAKIYPERNTTGVRAKLNPRLKLLQSFSFGFHLDPAFDNIQRDDRKNEKEKGERKKKTPRPNKRGQKVKEQDMRNRD